MTGLRKAARDQALQQPAPQGPTRARDIIAANRAYAQGYQSIDTSGLPDAEKEAAKQKLKTSYSSVLK